MGKKWNKFKNVFWNFLDWFFGILSYIIEFGIFYFLWFKSNISKETILFFIVIYFWIKVNHRLSRTLGLQGW